MEIAKLAVASVALALALSFTAFAGIQRQGESCSDAWWHDYGDRQYPSNTWVWLNGNRDGTTECYYLDRDGWLLADTATLDDYQVNAGGQQTTYGQIHRVYSTAATRGTVRTTNDKTYRPREAARDHGKDGSFDEDTGRCVGGPESPLAQRTF